MSDYRPIKEVDESSPELREVWWNPVLKKPMPNVVVWLVILVGLILSLAASLIFGLLVIAGSIAFFVRRIRGNAAPVEATSLQRLREEISGAITKQMNQIGPDLGVTGEEFKDAQAQNLLLVLSSGEGETYNKAAGVFQKIQTYVAIITPKGLGYLKGFYNTIDATFTPDIRELILWKKVDRVVVSANSLEINVGINVITVPLDSNNKVVSPGFGDSITELVNPFVREAQKRLVANA